MENNQIQKITKYSVILIIAVLIVLFVFKSREIVKEVETPAYTPAPNQSIPVYRDPYCLENYCKG